MAIVDLRVATRKDIKIEKADSVRLEMQFKQDGVAIDMSGYTDSEAKVLDADTGDELADFTIDYTAAASGTIVLTLTVTQTTDLCPCNGLWYLKVVLASDPANNSKTVVKGTFDVRPKTELLNG